MIRTLELDGVPILFDPITNGRGWESNNVFRSRIEELGDRISYGVWDKDDYPLKGHMLIVSLSKLEEAEFPPIVSLRTVLERRG